MNASEAIARSVSHTEIVTLPYDVDLAIELAGEADGLADTSTHQEFWGTTDAGGEWRVHLCHAEPLTPEELAACKAQP